MLSMDQREIIQKSRREWYISRRSILKFKIIAYKIE